MTVTSSRLSDRKNKARARRSSRRCTAPSFCGGLPAAPAGARLPTPRRRGAAAKDTGGRESAPAGKRPGTEGRPRRRGARRMARAECRAIGARERMPPFFAAAWHAPPHGMRGIQTHRPARAGHALRFHLFRLRAQPEIAERETFDNADKAQAFFASRGVVDDDVAIGAFLVRHF